MKWHFWIFHIICIYEVHILIIIHDQQHRNFSATFWPAGTVGSWSRGRGLMLRTLLNKYDRRRDLRGYRFIIATISVRMVWHARLLTLRCYHSSEAGMTSEATDSSLLLLQWGCYNKRGYTDSSLLPLQWGWYDKQGHWLIVATIAVRLAVLYVNFEVLHTFALIILRPSEKLYGGSNAPYKDDDRMLSKEYVYVYHPLVQC